MPGTRMVPFNDLVSLEKALSGKQAAAFIVEPVQGKSCEFAADGYLAEAQRLCNKHGTLLIGDEVQCGLGRTANGLPSSIGMVSNPTLSASPRPSPADTCRSVR